MQRVTVVDVAARDGLQNEKTHLDTQTKLELIAHLEAAGVKSYEATSFVHPRWVPQMADAETLFSCLPPSPGVTRWALLVNDRGYARARAAGADHVRLVVAATEMMNQKNANRSPAETLESYGPIVQAAREDGVAVTGVIGVSFGCPFEGTVDPGRVLDLAAKLAEMGVGEIDFADTVGMGVPNQVSRMISAARQRIPGMRLGVHLHNTRGTGLANAYAAVEAGAEVVDASLGGAGGCPFAPRATGNIATEDLVFMLEGMGVSTGIDLERLIEASAWFSMALGRDLPGMVTKAGACWTGAAPVA